MQLVFAALYGGFCGAAQVDVAFVEAGADGGDGGADDGADDVVFCQDAWGGGRCCGGFCGREDALGDAGQGEVGDVVFSGKAEDGFVACFYLPDVGGLAAFERGQGEAKDVLVEATFDGGEGGVQGAVCFCAIGVLLGLPAARFVAFGGVFRGLGLR